MVVPAVALAACAPALNWRSVQPAHAHGLSALFPCKPDRLERRVPWPGLPASVTMHMLTCEAQERTWVLSYLTLPDVSQVAPALRHWPALTRQNLELAAGSAQAVRANDLGAIQVPRMTPYGYASAWYFEAARADGLGRPMPFGVRAWHFAHGMTVFQASVSGAPGLLSPQSGEDPTQAFFLGFQFPG